MPLSPEAEHAAELIRIASEEGAKQANARLEQALDDLHMAAALLAKAAVIADRHGEHDLEDEFLAFIKHIRSEWG